MAAASEEPQFVPVAADSASGDSLVESDAAHDAATDPAPESERRAPHPWRFWLAWSAIGLGAVMFGHSWWRARQQAIAVERTNKAVERISAGEPGEAIFLLTEAV